MKTNDQYGKFISRGEIRIVRTLPGPIERVWEFLTDPDKRARWFAGGPMEPRQGGKLELFIRHANIAPGETPPEKFKHIHDPGFKMVGTVLRWEPPRVLSYTFDEDSDVTFELTPQGKEVVLVLTHHSRGEELPFLTCYASGWHSHLTLLLALLEGAPLPLFWAPHLKLKGEYEKLFAALPPT
jgi:uncharacterized protein YndB with AHSA1/START domain